MSGRLVSGDLVRINGFSTEVENKYGTIVGYADENPIVQLVDVVSKEYPYTTLIVPEKCILTKDKMSRDSADWHFFEIEEGFNATVQFADLTCQLQVQFSRKVHQNLMTTLQQSTGVIGAPDSTLITTIKDNSNGHHSVCNEESTGHYIFEFLVDLRSYPQAGRKALPWSKIKFEIMYPEWVVSEEQEWFNPKNWNGKVDIEVCYIDKKAHKDERAFYTLTSSQKLDEALNMMGVVEDWQKMYKRAQEMMAE